MTLMNAIASSQHGKSPAGCGWRCIITPAVREIKPGTSQLLCAKRDRGVETIHFFQHWIKVALHNEFRRAESYAGRAVREGVHISVRPPENNGEDIDTK